MEIELELILYGVYVLSLFSPELLKPLLSVLPCFTFTSLILLLMTCFVEHIVEECAPDASEAGLRLPLGLLTDFSILVI